MNTSATDSSSEVANEIAMLIDRLHATDQRLEELLAGEIDSVTDRQGRTILLRRAQGHVRSSENARQSAIVNALPAHIAMLDAQGFIVSVSEAWKKFGAENDLGSQRFGVGLNYLTMCDQTTGEGQENAEQAASGIRAVLAGEIKSFSMEYPCHSATEQRWFLLRAAPLADSPPHGAVVMHINTTDLRLSANALAALSARTEQRERMFNTMLSSISDFAYIYGHDGRFLFVNKPMLDMWGLSLDAVVGKNFAELGYPADVAEELQRQIQEVFESRTSRRFETPYLHRAPMAGYYEYVYSPAMGADGRVDFVVGVTRDITERKRNQSALRELNVVLEQRVAERTAALARQEALFHALADHAPAIIWMLDASGASITYLNRAGAQLLGGNEADWLGKSMMSVIHPDDLEANMQEHARAMVAATTFVSVRRLRAADGAFRTMSCQASPVFDARGAVDFWIGLEVDITDLKDALNALHESNRELQTFSYSIAHDLRSPMTLIDGFSRLLEKELGQAATVRATHLLARVRSGVQQLDQVSAGLLTLAGLSNTVATMAMTDMSQIAREVADLLTARNPERQVTLNIESGMVAWGDAGMLRSLILNLIGNAWKFTSKVEHAQISFSALPGSTGGMGDVVYCIKDNGAGFDLAYADKLFLPFQRLHSSEEFEGTGIGLATVRKIVDRHKGWIRAAGEPGKGASFTFTLGPADKSVTADLQGAQGRVVPALS